MNNQKNPKRTKEGKCKRCRITTPKQRTYCDSCYANKHVEAAEVKIQKWLSGEWSGGTDKKLNDVIRRYLLELCEYKCSKCGYDTPHPDDGATILEVNHIDGDGTNHKKENLEVLCPNCHALTSTYRGRNSGRGTRNFIYVRQTKKT